MLLDYYQTLDIVEKFMIDSRIREYCTDICKGRCCRGCYEKNPEACHRQEGRRLACSIYLCTALYKLLSKKDQKTLIKVHSTIASECCRFVHKDICFNVPPEKFFKKSRFSLKSICRLDKDITKRINITMAKLIINKTAII